MLSFSIISLVALLVVLYGTIEFKRHQRYLRSIPVRIHINGTRGKSSVTRLLGAGLRAGGLRTITKVTGTFPRIILPDGTEAVVHRKEKANILEQLDIIRYCAQQNAEVLIIECMALQPIYQKITEHQMVRATIGVITNIRLDHLDVMGPGISDVAKALCGTIPKRSLLFTSENRYQNFMKRKAEALKTQFHQSLPETVTDEEMEGFTYIEHKENVSLALDICAQLGVERSLALAEMKRSIPDEGVLRRYTVYYGEKRIHFYNALAANDPESTLMIWEQILKSSDDKEHLMIVLNTRKDRQDRAIRLVEMMASLQYDSIGLIGESLDGVLTMCKKQHIPRQAICAVGTKPTLQQYQELCQAAGPATTILAIGNMGAGGAELADYFEQNHQ
ncbi:MAG: poly-gamma-glutamate synthase PgsB [Bacteroidota bacterium]